MAVITNFYAVGHRFLQSWVLPGRTARPSGAASHVPENLKYKTSKFPGCNNCPDTGPNMDEIDEKRRLFESLRL